MAVRQFASPVTTNVTLTTTAETVIATLSNLGTTAPGQPINLNGWAQITSGTATTAITLRIRRDSVTGTLIGEGNPTQLSVAAGSTEDHQLETQDSFTGEVPSQTYVLTAQQTAATGDGSVLQAYLGALVG